MVKRNIDIAKVVIDESVKRLVEEVQRSIDSGEIKLLMSCPLEARVGYEQMKKLTALNIVMTRIIRSTSFN